MFGSPMVSMHQVTGFAHIQVLPAGLYGERTLLMGGKVCVTQDTNLEAVDWLQEVGLGPEEVIRIPGTCMFAGLKNDSDPLKRLVDLFGQGFRPMFFRPTELEADFIKQMGLAWEQTASCDPMVASMYGNKDFLRRMATAEGYSFVFPPHRIVGRPWKEDVLSDAISEVQATARDMKMSHVLVKRTDLVSGEGMCRITSSKFRSFLQENRAHSLIVEVEIDPHVPISNQWFVRDGKAHYLGASRHLHEGYIHQGDVFASHEGVLPEHVIKRLREITEPLVAYALRMGFNGFLEFDAVWNEERMMLYLTEANARVTGATYALAVAHRLGFTPWAIAHRTMVPALWFETFNSVRGALGSMLYNPRRQQGVVPYMIGALKHATMRRMGLMAIADNPDRAEKFLAEAVRRLTELRR